MFRKHLVDEDIRGKRTRRRRAKRSGSEGFENPTLVGSFADRRRVGDGERLGGFLVVVTTGLCRNHGLALVDLSRSQRQKLVAYGVGGLLLLVTLLVGLGFGLVWLTLLGVEGLPSLPEDFANLAWIPRNRR